MKRQDPLSLPVRFSYQVFVLFFGSFVFLALGSLVLVFGNLGNDLDILIKSCRKKKPE